jgi:hypothetical protein
MRFSRSFIVASLWLLAGCSREEAAPPARASTHSALITNGDFETGAPGQAPSAPWVVSSYLNASGVTIQTPQTLAGLNLAAGGSSTTTIVAATSAVPVNLTSGASLRVCRYGTQCAHLNAGASTGGGHAKNINRLSQTMVLGAGDVDAADAQLHLRFVFAAVMEDPGHTLSQEPYYFLQLTDLTKGTVVFTQFGMPGQFGQPWLTSTTSTTTYRYTPWQLIDISGAAGLSLGDTVTLDVIAAGCSLGAHQGDVYLDGVGVTVPGLSLEATGPARTAAGGVLTYQLQYVNHGSSMATGVTTSFTTPPSTTFHDVAPPAGATCTTPSVGTAGDVVCTFSGPVAAGQSGSFSVQVTVDPLVTDAAITLLNSSIASTQEPTLLGPFVSTPVLCGSDAQCNASSWCNLTGLSGCVPKLSNGTSLPKDAAHVTPVLDGHCSAGAGAAVCRSGVCDVADDRCGFAAGDGTCTSATAPSVCRSGLCSANGACLAAGGCNIDADCASGAWCDTGTHACLPKLANGLALPVAPPLDGTCGQLAGARVCLSGVCDTSDNSCGYANSDGSCDASTASVVCRSGVCDTDAKCGLANGAGSCTAQTSAVCRSGVCSVADTCMASGGCNVDADCSAGTWCDLAQHACLAVLANGAALPVDATHGGPVLDGHCSTAAGALVCASGVCDVADDLCGLAVGTAGCTSATGAPVCRTGTCSHASTCMPTGGCNVDADCAVGSWCHEASHACLTRLANDAPMPTDASHQGPVLDGTCTQAAATLVCASGVCDTDARCGLGTRGAPCTASTAATVCRSASCSADGSCEPSGGCNVDRDCTAGHWCDEATHACTPLLANGTALPVDASHVEATLDGSCTATAAVIVCVAGVCDADGACGYRNGDGPCTAATGATLCRSGLCATDAAHAATCVACLAETQCPTATPKCDPASDSCVAGCVRDTDCPSEQWCSVTGHHCTARLMNGSAMPTDAAHGSPALDGTCTAAAAAHVCLAEVCEVSDNACGLKDGTACTGDAQCRTGTCDATSGTCGAPVVSGCQANTDCPTGQTCTSAHTCEASRLSGGGCGCSSVEPAAVFWLAGLVWLRLRRRSGLSAG